MSSVIDKYLKNIKSLYHNIGLLGNLNIEKDYVIPTLNLSSMDSSFHQEECSFKDIFKRNEIRYYIEGESGIGKSSLLKYWTYSLCCSYKNDNINLIPILIEVPFFSFDTHINLMEISYLEFVDSINQYVQKHYNVKQILNKIESNNLVPLLMFDSFETLNPVKAEKIIQAIHHISIIKKDIGICVASRTRYPIIFNPNSNFIKVDIINFKHADQKRKLISFYANTPSIYDQIEENEYLNSISNNPARLSILSIVWEYIGEDKYRINEIFDNFIYNMIKNSKLIRIDKYSNINLSLYLSEMFELACIMAFKLFKMDTNSTINMENEKISEDVEIKEKTNSLFDFVNSKLELKEFLNNFIKFCGLFKEYIGIERTSRVSFIFDSLQYYLAAKHVHLYPSEKIDQSLLIKNNNFFYFYTGFINNRNDLNTLFQDMLSIENEDIYYRNLIKIIECLNNIQHDIIPSETINRLIIKSITIHEQTTNNNLKKDIQVAVSNLNPEFFYRYIYENIKDVLYDEFCAKKAWLLYPLYLKSKHSNCQLKVYCQNILWQFFYTGPTFLLDLPYSEFRYQIYKILVTETEINDAFVLKFKEVLYLKPEQKRITYIEYFLIFGCYCNLPNDVLGFLQKRLEAEPEMLWFYEHNILSINIDTKAFEIILGTIITHEKNEFFFFQCMLLVKKHGYRWNRNLIRKLWSRLKQNINLLIHFSTPWPFELLPSDELSDFFQTVLKTFVKTVFEDNDNKELIKNCLIQLINHKVDDILLYRVIYDIIHRRIIANEHMKEIFEGYLVEAIYCLHTLQRRIYGYDLDIKSHQYDVCKKLGYFSVIFANYTLKFSIDFFLNSLIYVWYWKKELEIMFQISWVYRGGFITKLLVDLHNDQSLHIKVKSIEESYKIIYKLLDKFMKGGYPTISKNTKSFKSDFIWPERLGVILNTFEILAKLLHKYNEYIEIVNDLYKLKIDTLSDIDNDRYFQFIHTKIQEMSPGYCLTLKEVPKSDWRHEIEEKFVIKPFGDTFTPFPGIDPEYDKDKFIKRLSDFQNGFAVVLFKNENEIHFWDLKLLWNEKDNSNFSIINDVEKYRFILKPSSCAMKKGEFKEERDIVLQNNYSRRYGVLRKVIYHFVKERNKETISSDIDKNEYFKIVKDEFEFTGDNYNKCFGSIKDLFKVESSKLYEGNNFNNTVIRSGVEKGFKWSVDSRNISIIE